MTRLAVLLFLFSPMAMAQNLNQVTQDVVNLLTEGVIAPELVADGCPLDDEVQTAPDEYVCDADPQTVSAPLFAPENLIELPDNHPLREKHKIRFVSIGTSLKVVNDNHQGTFVGLPGDDSGNTFGGDLGLNSVLAQGDKRYRIGVNYSLRQYTKPLSGYTEVNPENNSSKVYYLDENGDYVQIEVPSDPSISKNYEKTEELFNQVSLTSTVLHIDLMIDQPILDNSMVLSYGAKLGLRRLDDTKDQLGAKIQDDHHRNNDLYRFEWGNFSNLLVNGVYNYVTVEPQVGVEFPTVKFANNVCTLKSSSYFSVAFNSLVEKQRPQQRLNPIEPKLNLNIGLGIMPLKYSERSIIELNSSLNYDPHNKLPLNANPGTAGTFDVGMRINGRIGKKFEFYVVPVEFFVPLNNPNDNANMLSGKYIKTGLGTIKADELHNDVFGTWGEIGLIFKIN